MMIEEKGRIISLDGDAAWVETQRTTVCNACSINKGCGTGILSKFFNAKPMRLRAINAAQVGVGDEVIVGLEDDALVRGSFIAYAMPLFTMLILALAGKMLAGAYDPELAELGAVIGGVTGLFLGFAGLSVYSARHRRDRRYQPVIVRRVNG